MKPSFRIAMVLVCLTILSACQAPPTPTESVPPTATATPEDGPTPLPTRTLFAPGEILAYSAQSGDTLPAIAAHFNTSIGAILEANPSIPDNATTFPEGFQIQVPAYYQPLSNTPFQILPNSEFINGPGAIGFDTEAEVRRHPGFINQLSGYVQKQQRPAWELVDIVALNYSLHPRLLLTLLEHQSGALSNPFPGEIDMSYPMGNVDPGAKGLYLQLVWAAEQLCQGYYGWRTGKLSEIEVADGRLLRPDPWQNAGTVGVYTFFASLEDLDQIIDTISPEGFQKTYRSLWNVDPFALEIALLPGNLQQPIFTLPFLPDVVWAYSAGPHFAWGTTQPMGAIDFAPPAVQGGCAPSDQWVTALADGTIVRSEEATVVLDLDGDQDERTGWVIFYFHMAAEGRIASNVEVAQGDLLGHPSCEGGRATGTHVHIARKFNGEWLPAAGPLGFNLDGWTVAEGSGPYLGTMTKGSKVVEACTCSTSENQIRYELP